jgi:hypothetical protein
MDAEGLDREWSAWLEERKRPAPPDPGFTRRVMEAVRAELPRGRAAVPPARSAWPGWIRGLLSPRPALAFATLALAAGLAIRYFPGGPGQDRAGTRIKGEAFRVGYLLKRGDRIAPARSGEGYGPGDRLQAIYSSDRAGYIRFFSLDASGRIECLSCSGADSLWPAGQAKAFPFALELDADPADEALVGIWTPAPSNAPDLETWLRGAWARSSGGLSGLEAALSISAPASSRLSIFLLRKKAGL